MQPPLTALVAMALAAFCGTPWAAPLNLAQSPAALGREPAPNVIVSVDDSGSMEASGMATLKSALQQTFSEAYLPSNRVRLAWQSMHRCRGIPSDSGDCRNRNGMARLSDAHRAHFMNWVNTLTHGGGTPSHLMIDEAGRYLSRTGMGINSPWAANPGIAELPLLSCRKSFHIFMTDGSWNGANDRSRHVDTSGSDGARIVRGGNADNTAIDLPDGVRYDTASTQTRLYRDSWGTNGLSTLSDLAFYYWSRDLQPGMANNVRPSPNQQWPRQNFGSPSSPAELDPYWNPRNNPATWQHMVNYTIGFNGAAVWTGSPVWGGDTFNNLASLINNATSWPSPFCSRSGATNVPCDGTALYESRENERKVELWHAALNSRGRFVPANNASALASAFQGILDDILHQTSQPLVSLASSSSRLRSDGLLYVAGFNSTNWSGNLRAYAIDARTHNIGTTPSWSAHNLLDATTFDVNARNVLTHNGRQGVQFIWEGLNEAQQQALQGTSSRSEAQRRLDYLRGSREFEINQPGGTLRQRDSRLGDIANSNIWLTSRPTRQDFEHTGHRRFRETHAQRRPVLYVGANDGMLHAFSAEDGRELMAYVPMGVYGHLSNYTRPDYVHRYFVDGHAFTGDVDVSGRGIEARRDAEPEWHTVLVGGLGGGGRGYFVLDVTTPLAVGDPTSSFQPQSVMLDRTFSGTGAAPNTENEDIGHIFAQPVVSAVDGSRSEQIVKLNNGRWAVVMGNGINSVNERPVLLIQYLDGERELFNIVAHSATRQSNGLSAPRLIDVNGDGKVDIAYAGDLQGNLWKFNLMHVEASRWGVSDWTGRSTPCKDSTNCVPLYVARDAASPANRQPITTAPLWMKHPMGGVQLLFGSGRNVEEADRSDDRVQSLYAVWDQSEYNISSTGQIESAEELQPITQGRSALVRQSVTGAVTSRASGTELPTNYFNTSTNGVAYSRTDTNAPRGWYLDLPETRERVLSNPQIFEGQKVLMTTTAPPLSSAEETCSFEGEPESGWVNVLNMITGQPSKTPVLSSTDATMALNHAARARFSNGEFTGIYKSDGNLNLISLTNSPGNASCDPTRTVCTRTETLTTGKSLGRRADWLEIQ